jgi:hypothetical protein
MVFSVLYFIIKAFFNFILKSCCFNKYWYVRFEVFTAVTMKKAVFWDVAPCRSSSETSVNTTSTRYHIPEDCFLQILI